MTVYYPDTLEFDFSGIIGSIGAGIVSVGTKVLTQQNIATVVSGLVARQVAKATAPKPAPAPVYVTQPGAAAVPMPYPSVSTQPTIIMAGGGGVSPVSVAPVSPFAGFSLASIHPAYLILGALGVGYFIFKGRE